MNRRNCSINSLFGLVALSLVLATSRLAHAAGQGSIKWDVGHKTVLLSDGAGQLSLRLNYDGQCVLDQVNVRGRQVVSPSGTTSGVLTGGRWYTTKKITTPRLSVSKNTLTVSNILFGEPEHPLQETWLFTVRPEGISWKITRRYPQEMTLEDAAFPQWNFQDMSTWTGGILGNGGVVWNKYLDTPNATYGAHTGEVTFWNPQQHDCLRITPTLPTGLHGAVRFSHQANAQNEMSFNYTVSPDELSTKHNLYHFLSDRQDLWAPFKVPASEESVEFNLQALDYDAAYNRGTFRGLDGNGIRELLNTIGRYGVIDSQLIGANGWRTGYICLHEQWFAQIGLALNDPHYTANYASTLNYERDHAVNKDGRVLARWHHDAGDAMRGTYTPQGFYEAQWGYLMDSQPDYVMNVAEQFDLSGDTAWLQGQKATCEAALEYLMRREVGNTGLVAVLTDSQKEAKGSDWFDIVWASYQNALINAELYYALNLWADSEETLGDTQRATTYRAFATKLKASFNRSVAEGGFWDPTNQWYAYWRDKDGFIHGDNLFVAVNFAAIGYGLCDDSGRKKAILDRIEAEMQKEDLFHWPANFFSFDPSEASRGNFPFPNYENGDIFMSWGELGVRAYAAYDPEIALKYVRKTLARYAQDGLSYQRYLRRTQAGAGDDILAGNCMTIVGLYRDIYGIQPKPNRLYLEPHLTPDLDGTQLLYNLRGQQYIVGLNTTSSSITANGCTLRDTAPFAANATASGMQYFPAQSKQWALSVNAPSALGVTVQIENWPTTPDARRHTPDARRHTPDARRHWAQSTQAKSKVQYTLAQLQPDATYTLRINGKAARALRADSTGHITFTAPRSSTPQSFELALGEN